MGLGPVMLDVLGKTLTAEDEARLKHPLVGGVILFRRNYESPRQLAELTGAIHALRSAPLLIAVDHEGGRVQRFREGFSRLPPMRDLGKIWDDNPKRARHLAQQAGYVLAAELRAHGVDFSFTPVLDMDYGTSTVIGDRAFHSGHGYVRADSHVDIPVDDRGYTDIELQDLVPFRHMINSGMQAIMPAHVIYPKVDDKPAGFSEVWLKKVLRGELGFEGCIFSDDLSMEGATVAGGIVQRAEAALNAGCDMALVCNRPDLADELLASLDWDMSAASRARLAHMRGHPHPLTMVQLHEQVDYLRAAQEVAGIGTGSGDLPLA
jgi:beta-N-acetylhexosaminidase